MKVKLSVSVVAACSVFALAMPTAANARPARCEIAMVGWIGPDRYVAPCDFVPGSNGSFTLRGPEGGSLIEFVERVQVEILRPGVARAQTFGFRNSADASNEDRGNLGPWIIRRDTRNPACWIGEDVRICAF